MVDRTSEGFFKDGVCLETATDRRRRQRGAVSPLRSLEREREREKMREEREDEREESEQGLGGRLGW